MNYTKGWLERAVSSITAAFGMEHFRGVIVLGSGLSNVVDELGSTSHLNYTEIEGFGGVRVEGHAGKVSLYKDVLIFQGRRHSYEGLPANRLADSVWVGHALGAAWVCSFCAVGSLRTEWGPGTMVSVTDHINFSGANPLIEEGEGKIVFPSMMGLYEHSERSRVMNSLGLQAEGVYACMSGPQYETRAESIMLQRLGADIVGMSLVPEALVAARNKLKMFGYGCVTNHAPGIGQEDADHKKVVENARSFHSLAANVIREVLKVTDVVR